MFWAVASDGGGVGRCRAASGDRRGYFFLFARVGRASCGCEWMKGHEAEGIQHGRLSLLAAGQASIMLVPTTPLRTRSQAHSRNPNAGCLVPEDVGFGVDLYDFWHGECGNGCRYQPCRSVPLLIKHWTAPKRRVQECASIGQRRNGVFKTVQALDNAETAPGTCAGTKDPNRCSHVCD